MIVLLRSGHDEKAHCYVFTLRAVCDSPMGAHGTGVFLLGIKVIPASRYQIPPPVFLCVMQGETIPSQAHQFRCQSHLQADQTGSRWPAVVRHLLAQLTIPPKEENKEEKELTYTTSGKQNWKWLCGVWERSYPGCAGRCCLLLGSRFTVSFRFSTASRLGQGPSISSSDGGPGSNIKKLNYLCYFINILYAL